MKAATDLLSEVDSDVCAKLLLCMKDHSRALALLSQMDAGSAGSVFEELSKMEGFSYLMEGLEPRVGHNLSIKDFEFLLLARVQ